MKKMLSLALALVLCLTSVAAFAEAAIPSKVAGTVAVSTEGITATEVTAEEIAAAEEELAELAEAGTEKYFADITDTTKTEDNEGVDRSKLVIDEFAPINLTVDEAVVDEEGKVEAEFNVDFPYAAGDVVYVLLGVKNADGTISWTIYAGVATENGVSAKVDAEVLNNAGLLATGTVEEA